MAVIGIAGKKGAGKTEVRRYLERTYGFQCIPFAAPLKDMLKALGLSEDEVNGSAKQAPCALLGGVTPRLAMQTLGTEWGRMMISEDLWSTIWENRARQMSGPVVADDARFPNEFEVIRRIGGKVLRVVRPSKEGSEVDHHPSETLADELDVDYTITNNGTLIALQKAVDKALHIVGAGR